MLNPKLISAISSICRVSMIFMLMTSDTFGEEVTVHYHRPDGDYDGWTLWTWNPDSGKNLEAVSADRDDFGLVFRLKLEDYGGAGSSPRIGLLPKFKSWEKKDDPDKTWTSALGNAVYLVAADKNIYSTRPSLAPRVVQARLDDTDLIRIVLSKSIAVGTVVPQAVTVRDGRGAVYRVSAVTASDVTDSKTKIIDVRLVESYPVSSIAGGLAAVLDYQPGPIAAGEILNKPVFFSDAPLGAIYAHDRTVFRTFAPPALGVTLRLYDRPSGGTPKEYPMNPIGGGVFAIPLWGDLASMYYTYLVRHVDGDFEVVDPYSRCNTAHNGRGMVVVDATPVSSAPDFRQEDAIVYELHVRDFTTDPASGIHPSHRGKYLGLVQEGSRYVDDPGVLTGIDHLKELGVNVVQILPIQDFDNNESSEDYNWGYMPVHFNSPDGWYATRRDDATRVREVKQMIDGFHRAGIKVVMDVVYNHTAEGNPNVRFSFNGLAPNYYYRLRPDGTYWNGSGTGNEFRSESPMGRKFIIDSLKYWVTEYKVDGFRFDLMGLVDIETIKQFVAELRKINPDLLIYGEPWAGGETPIDKTEKGDQRGWGFGVFNDHFRDGIKGSTFGKNPGFVQSWPDVQRIKRGIKGSITDFAKEPVETINYVEAHDNHTLWDRIEITTNVGYEVSRQDRVQMDKMAAALILTSQGIPFLHAGQEMLRTKEGEDNSYNLPDRINQIHWRWKKENREVFEYYRDLIWLRRRHPMFRMTSATDIKNNIFFLDDDLGLPVPSNAVAYVLHRGKTNDEWSDALLLFNAKPMPSVFHLPGGKWTPVKIGGAELPFSSDTIVVPARTVAVFYTTEETFFKTVLAPALAGRKARIHKFIVAAPKASRVEVAGSFNSWKQGELALQKRPDGKWSLEMELEPGTYEYKYIADGNWETLNKDNQKVTIR